MSTGFGKVGKTTNWQQDVAGAQIQGEREEMWGELPGEIVEWDPKTQTAKIQPLYKKRLNGEPTMLPELEDVPVRFPRIGGFVITMPVKAGDKVTLRPQMRNSELYHENDGPYEAADARSFSLSDMEAFLDGGESLKRPIEEFNDQNLEIRTEEGFPKIEMAPDGTIRLMTSEDVFIEIKSDGITFQAPRIDHRKP